MKKLFLIFIILILLTSSIKASPEGNYIASQSWNTIEKTSYAILALKQETGYSTKISSGISSLKNSLDSCIPSNSCNVKDVALATLALKGTSSTTLINAVTWLINSRSIQYSGDLEGWLIQVVSSEAGICTLTNTETNQEQTLNIQAGYTPWIPVSSNLLTANTEDLNLDCSDLSSSDLILSLIQKKTVEGITHYYIKQEEHSKNTITVEFGDPCWGNSYRSTSACDKDTTALVLYALKQAGTQADATWLKQQASLSPLQNAYLYKITGDNSYLDSLESSQNTAGDWQQDVFTTSLISYLIAPSNLVTKANSWINQNKNTASNCWTSISCDLITTSAALLAVSPSSSTTTIVDADNDNIDDSWEDENCYGDCNPDDDPDFDDLTNYQEYIHGTDPYDSDTDGDGYTDGEEVEAGTDPLDENNYPDSDSGSSTTSQRQKDCPEGNDCQTVYNCPGICNSYGQCIDIEGDNCPETDTEDCIYGEDCTTSEGCQGTCNIYGECEDISGDNCPYTGSSSAGTSQKKSGDEGHGVLFWLFMVLLLLVALGGGSYFAYKKGLIKFGKKPPKKPSSSSYQPKLKIPQKKSSSGYQPLMRQKSKKSPIRKHMEKTLDKSMKELEDLLKGK